MTLKKQMVIEFPEKWLPEICSIKRKLQTLEGVKIYMEPKQIRYPGFSLDMLQRKVMVEEKEVLLTAREFDVLAVMARHPGRVYTYAQICRMIYGETDVGEEMYSSAYCNRYNHQGALLFTQRPLSSFIRYLQHFYSGNGKVGR